MSRFAGAILAAALALAVPAAASAQMSDADITRGLMSTRWCSFSYNQTTGYSSRRVAQFLPGGVLTIGGNAEGGSSGQNGSFYSQTQGGDRFHWRVQAAQLLLAADDGVWGAYVLDGYRTSSGTIVLKVAGAEWVPC